MVIAYLSIVCYRPRNLYVADNIPFWNDHLSMFLVLWFGGISHLTFVLIKLYHLIWARVWIKGCSCSVLFTHDWTQIDWFLFYLFLLSFVQLYILFISSTVLLLEMILLNVKRPSRVSETTGRFSVVLLQCLVQQTLTRLPHPPSLVQQTLTCLPHPPNLTLYLAADVWQNLLSYNYIAVAAISY